jgi:hypothetical protein
MKTIWKYPVGFYGPNHISLPADAKILHVDRRDHISHAVAFWAEVNPSIPSEIRSFQVVGTGHQISPNMEHIGTTIDGSYVWHLYEVKGD